MSQPAEPPPALLAHDREQIELQLTQALSSSEARRQLGLELYFFVPRNIGLSADNYPRDEFYADLTTYARVDLPPLSLEQLADETPPPEGTPPHAPRSPLCALLRHAEAIGRGERPVGPANVEVKLFGHQFTEAVRDEVARLQLRLLALPAEVDRDPRARWRLLDEIDRFAHAARAALRGLRRAQRRFDPLSRAAPILETLQITDEHSSLFLDGGLAILARAAEEQAALYDGSGFVGRLHQALARHAEAEARYRTECGYLNLGMHGAHDGGAEYFAYRQSLLKKAVQQALYVDTRRLQSDTFVRNTAGAVAAGLAATWALVAQIPAQVSDLSAGWQTALFALPVVAYVLKDRIKEVTREWLMRRVRGFDNDVAIAAGSLAEAGLGQLAGRVRERATFLAPSDVPEEVNALRVARRTVRTADPGGETVLCYRRTVEVGAAKGAPPPTPGLSLRQIVRLNLRHFLVRMDDPRQEESHYAASEARFVTVPLPKVYHVNLIARVTGEGAAPSLSRWRIVIDKEGIVRLDHVADAPPPAAAVPSSAPSPLAAGGEAR